MRNVIRLLTFRPGVNAGKVYHVCHMRRRIDAEADGCLVTLRCQCGREHAWWYPAGAGAEAKDAA